MAAAQQGDHRAFQTLVERYHERLYHLAVSYVGDRDDADDVAQEIFVKAFRALHAFRGQSQFYTWLYRIGLNACLDWVKSRSRRLEAAERVLAEGGGTDVVAGMGAGSRPTDDRVEQRELRARLSRALNRLSEDYRSAVVLRELEGLAYEEIAEVLKCSVGTVKSRLFRARAQLHDILSREESM